MCWRNTDSVATIVLMIRAMYVYTMFLSTIASPLHINTCDIQSAGDSDLLVVLLSSSSRFSQHSLRTSLQWTELHAGTFIAKPACCALTVNVNATHQTQIMAALLSAWIFPVQLGPDPCAHWHALAQRPLVFFDLSLLSLFPLFPRIPFLG